MLRFIGRQCASRKLMVFSICFLFGAVFADCGFLNLRISLLLAASGTAASLWAGRMHFRRAALLIMIPAFLLGNARMHLAHHLNPPVQDHYSIEFEGKVISDPTYNAETERIICSFQLETLDGNACDDIVRLYLRSEELPLEGIEYGQQLTCTGHVWPQDTASNPYQFDSRKWLLSLGMTGMAAAKLEDVRIAPFEGRDWESIVIRIRNAISGQIDALFPENADLVRAFVLGDRSGIDSDLRKAFNQTGVAHLIAISGMHISVLAMAVSRVLRSFLRRNTAVFASLAIVILYGMLIGFPASLIRATIMFAAFSLAPVFGLVSDSMTRISATMLGMLLVNPFFIYSSGFVLSFSASAGIILLEPPISKLFRVDLLKHQKPSPDRIQRLLQRAAAYFPQLLCSTLAAQLASLPAVTAYFGAQSLISIPVNLLAIPLAMTAYPLSLAALLLSAAVPSLGTLAASVPDMMFSCLVGIIRAFSTVQAGAFRIPRYPIGLLLAHCAIVLGASDLSKLSERIRRLLPVALAGLTTISVLCAWIASLPFRVIFFDAGQADAAILRAEGRNYLFDVGDVYTPVSDYASAACTGIDAVFLSHPHYDHAGGLSSLLEAVRPGAIYVPEGWFEVEAAESVQEGVALAQQLNIPILELRPGDRLELSVNVSLTVHETVGSSVNDMSLLLEVRYHDTGFLFTGDMTTKGEPKHIPDIDVLKVPHHGSSKTSSDFLVESASPQISVIPVGDNNYGHPSAETLERLTAAGSDIYRTDHCGAITVFALPDGSLHTHTYFSMEDHS